MNTTLSLYSNLLQSFSCLHILTFFLCVLVFVESFENFTVIVLYNLNIIIIDITGRILSLIDWTMAT